MESIQKAELPEQIQPSSLNVKKYSKYTMFFFIVLLLLITLGSYYVGLKKGKVVFTPTVLTPTLTQDQLPNEYTSKNKVYRNERLKFSVSYPERLQIKEFTRQYDDTISLIVFDSVEQGEMVDSYNKSLSIIVGGSDFKRSDFYYGGYEWTKSIIDALINEPNGTTKDHRYETITKLDTVPEFSAVKYLATVKDGTGTGGVPGSSETHWAILKKDANRTFLLSGTPEWINGVRFNYGTIIVWDESIGGSNAITINPNSSN